jgi:hypothetical protein
MYVVAKLRFAHYLPIAPIDYRNFGMTIANGTVFTGDHIKRLSGHYHW